MDGFIVIDKPQGITSHGVVSAVRRAAGQKKVGHTGTLDPFATGVLPVALGEGTKAIPFLDEQYKSYQAVMRLGSATDTQDCTGQIISQGEWSGVTDRDLERVVATFRGDLHQTPPMFSALKRDGVPLYKLARKGEEVERPARAITVYDLRIDAVSFPEVTFTVVCSRGTYVRTLAHDMGALLGCGAHLTALRRLSSGPFALGHAVTLEQLRDMSGPDELERLLLPPLQALAHLPELVLTEEGLLRVTQGRDPGEQGVDEAARRALTPGMQVRLSRDGRLAAVAETVATESEERPGLRIVRGFASFPFT